jgi:outer membrane protein assembly factor BamB
VSGYRCLLASIGLGVLLAASSSVARAQALPAGDTAWRYKAASDMHFMRQCPATELLISTDKALVALDATTGAELWQLSGLPSMDAGLYWGSCEASTGLSYRKNEIIAFDLGSGRRLWDGSALPPFQEIRGYVSLSSRDLLLLFLRTSTSDRALAAVQLSTGTLRWQRDDLFAESPRFTARSGVSDISEFQAVITDTDTTLILYVSADGPLRLDSRSGATLWKGESLGPRVPSLGDFAAMRVVDSVLVIPRGNGLVALDQRDGHRLWEQATLLPAHATRLVPVDAGLLVRAGRAFVTIVVPTTGAVPWDRPLTVSTDGVAYEIVGERYYVVTHDRLVVADLATGDTTGLLDLVFDDGEHADAMFEVEDGILIASRQNLFRVDFPGASRYHRFFKAPGATFFEKLGGALTGNIGVFGARLGAAQLRSEYAYFLTTTPDSAGRVGNSLVRVDLRNGAEAGRLWFRERAPKFRADPARDQVLVFEDARTLVAVRFPSSP